ncbi:hypothetical protein CLE01_19440 [Cryobacterium levicorallinum]|nr:hypothetical protein CLE01_19440 [Cryobacterium levicorallinum]
MKDAVLQDRHTVAQTHYLSEAMGDIDDAHALLTETVNNRVENFQLRLSKNG